MLIRWKSKDKSASSSQSACGSSSSSSKKKRKGREGEEDWQNDAKSGRLPSSEQVGDERRRAMRRDDPRRHTLGGDMLVYGGSQHPHAHQMAPQQQRAMDLEMSTRAQKNKKNQPMRGYAPVNQGPLFDDDPGIMSEVETASTGFRRGGKQRSSLPVVRTPSKTLERPLGLVFLQYRSETKRALLPNEITSIDTVRALFVRSFPRQLTMSYLEGPNVKIYIHDASKDMFYELEDVRSHLREIRDRSVLRLFESTEVAAPPQILPGGPGIPQPLPPAQANWDQDQSYFSEPEFDSDYKHQHIHKSKIGKQPAPYYVGSSQTLPRGMYSSERNKVSMGAPVKPLRSLNPRGSMEPLFPYIPDQLYSIPDGYTSSPERGSRGNYEEPYYSQYGTRGSVVAPIIDEEQSDGAMTEDQYALYGIKVGPGPNRLGHRGNQIYDPTRPEDLHRIRVEHMERQLANLTGLVQKALVNQNPQIAPLAVPTLDPNYLVVPTQMQANGSGDELYIREKAPKLGKNSCQKSVSFEKSVSFSDDIQGIPKSHNPLHAADTKPTKPAIKSSTLPRTSSQERDRLKPPPPPKPIVLAQTTHPNYRADIALAPEVYNHLRGLQKKAKDLRMEVRTLRRLSQAQAVAVREDIKGTFMRIRATLLASSGSFWDHQGDQDATRISREEELYKQEVIRLEKDLSDLEGSVENLRGEVINRRTRVNMTAVEDMALVLSRASKTVAELKLKFPALSNGLRCILSNEMEKVVREEKFLKEEPDRLESALRRCKKLTGTLVTLKRLASVQEQRLPPNEPTISEEPPRSADISAPDKPIPTPRMGTFALSGGLAPENALDALLDELKTFSKPIAQQQQQQQQPHQQLYEIRPEDSASDESAQAAVQSTVTTQISQARLYTEASVNIQQATTGSMVIAVASGSVPAQAQRGVLTHQHSQSQHSYQSQSQAQLMVQTNMGSLRRLHSYPSESDGELQASETALANGGGSSKPPVPERNAELITKVGHKRIPPPPPPRTSSRSPLASPTSPNMPQNQAATAAVNVNVNLNVNLNANANAAGNSVVGDAIVASGDTSSGDNSSGNESGNDHVQRQVALEMRHQELLKKQKLLQEQYQRLQQMSKLPSVDLPQTQDMAGGSNTLRKLGSETNIQQKIAALSLACEASGAAAAAAAAAAATNGVLASDATRGANGGALGGGGAAGAAGAGAAAVNSNLNLNSQHQTAPTTTKQLYETEIL
ncbi:coiled-coil domain-containing protein CG32809 isoform X1 [Drosophila gunungcola]|uniref:coiled-coil domain-containing protein CG32809 isoform X1 n=2 Tax=Drosophila gunungcola TaxID=103775 RepID=UPI0022E64B6A|nr:coiled-coil domain-containing protein CG32809 isoform X1 [Drosophila gunungcola]XP_052857007.1 coiled-coil domain-containing protein CG32809 isoform X1 [Drosophila gunungcola]XP_052857008.1 coiled-coil domain-containing protein CG32809 isoform X1 [Drosophila gunungcola]XP_052857009.1 coiled-coil domain-containing protein CG32809 isoform X1 [Drosophila gunungcola]